MSYRGLFFILYIVSMHLYLKPDRIKAAVRNLSVSVLASISHGRNFVVAATARKTKFKMQQQNKKK